jgi:hypothetical protein
MEMLKQGAHVVQLIPPHNHSGSASWSASSTTYISLKGYHGGVFVANMGAITGAVTFAFKQAKNVSASTPAALSIDGYYTDAAAVASGSTTNDTFVYTAYSSGSSSQATGTTNNTLYVFPFQAAQLNGASSYDCVGVAAAAANAYFGVTAILYPRYEQQVPTPAKAD